MRKLSKYLCCMISMLAILLSGQVGEAKVIPKDEISPQYVGTANIITSLNISSHGCAYCYGKVNLYSSFSADVEMELQRNGGAVWSTIKTWNASGSGTVVLDKNYYVIPGYNYRVKVTANVKNASGRNVESITSFSDDHYY